MTLTPGMITMDTTDATSLAAWWAKQTGGTIVQENDGWYVVVLLPGGNLRLAFQKVEQPTPGKNRIHLDLVADDLQAKVAELLESGASKVADREIPGFCWTTLTDPDGNQFCVSSPEPGQFG